jgi:hypothetical protein
MRLSTVETGHRLPQKLILRMIRLLSGDPNQPFDVVKTLLYRPEFFGKPYSELLQVVMRGPSNWTVGERELFAAFTSHKNECQF